MNKYSPQELVDKVNELMPMSDYADDGRMKDFSIRRLRDFQSKSLVSEPERDGRNVFYTDTHLNEVLNLRKLLKDGVSESSIQKMKNDSTSLVNTVINASSYLTSSSYLNSSQLNVSACNSSQNLTDVESQSSINDLLKSIAPENLNNVNNKFLYEGVSQTKSVDVKENISRTLYKNLSASIKKSEDLEPTVNSTYTFENGITINIPSGTSLNDIQKESLINKINQIIRKL